MAESPRPVERPSRSSRDRAPRRFWYEHHAGGRGLEAILLIGSVPFRLDSAAVRKLGQAIRENLVDARGVPLAFNETVWSCIQLANAFAEEREDGSSPEPIELGWNLVYGLCEHVLSDELVHGDAQLSALYEALLRYEAQGGWTT